MITEFDDRRCPKESVLVDYELTVFKGVDVTLDEQQIRARLDRQEPSSRNVDAVRVLEMLDRSTGCSFKLCRNFNE